MPDDNRMYPKQPLPSAIDRGLARPYDSKIRQDVRMGRDPLSRVKEDFSISQALESGRVTTRSLAKARNDTLGGFIDRYLKEGAGAYRRPMSRKERRSRR